MRYGQTRLADDLLPVQEEVEIDRARPVPRTGARAPELALDVEQHGEQVLRAERGVNRRDTVQKRRLVAIAPGLRLAQPRDGHELHTGPLDEQLERAGDRRLAVAQIRPDADVRPLHNG